MNRVVYYHHPTSENFSLQNSSSSVGEIRSYREETDAPTKLIGYPFEEPVYVLYVGDSEIRTMSQAEFDYEWLREVISHLPRTSQIVALRLFELFEAAAEARERDEFRLYKRFEPQNVKDAVDRVSWGETVPEVAGELMSNLILRHAPPNANHRTSIVMLQFCIESVDPQFQMPGTHLDDASWTEWVDRYITRSKRLITVRRNNVYFSTLEQLGVDAVERKDGLQIPLADYELEMHISEAHQRYAQKHEALCREFVEQVLERADRADLRETSGPQREAFSTYLEQTVRTRDLTNLF